MTPHRGVRLTGCGYYSENAALKSSAAKCDYGADEIAADLPRARLSELPERRRAQMLRRKTRRSGRSGQGDAWEEQAQGNGETPVRVMRQRTQARQGGGIPPTKYRAADGGCSAREESSFSPEGATSMRRLGPAPEGAMRGHGRGRSRAEPFWARRIRQDRGPTAYMYTPSGRVDGEAARPERRARLPRPWPHAGRQTHRTASYPNRGRTMSDKPTHTMHGNVKPQSVRSRRRRRRGTP